MIPPFFFSTGAGLNAAVIALIHEADTVGNPLHMLLDRRQHIGKHRRAAGAGHREQIGEIRHGQAKIAAWTIGPAIT